MKREALILALLLCQPAYAQSNVEDIGVKTGGYSTEEPQLKPALPEPAIEQSLVEKQKQQFQITKQEQTKLIEVPTVKIVDQSNLAKPGECTWKTVWEGTKQNAKRFGRGCTLWKAQTWKDNWNDGWAFAIRNDKKVSVTTNTILGANQAKELF